MFMLGGFGEHLANRGPGLVRGIAAPPSGVTPSERDRFIIVGREDAVTSGCVSRARSGWLTVLILSGIVLALAATVLGCGSPTPTTSSTGGVSSFTTQAASSTITSGGGVSTTTNSGSPTLGMSQIPGGLPVSGTSFLDGPVAVGGREAAQGSLPVIWRLALGSGWSAEDIDTSPRTAFAAFELNDAQLLGNRRLVVGVDLQDAQATSPEDSFAAVEKKGGGWDLSDLGTRVPAGTSVEVRGLGATGDPSDINTFFIAVGGAISGVPAKGYLFNDLTGATPISMVSVNGIDWNPAVTMPLPDGVSSAEATSVTFCGPNTPAPGVLATGIGYATDPKLGARLVGIVWRSTDQGTTWTIVSGSPFNEPGRNMSATFVASDETLIVVGGPADLPGT